MTTSLIIQSIDSNDKSTQKAIQNINPESEDSKLHDLATKFNALSKRTYVSSYRLDKKSLDDLQGE